MSEPETKNGRPRQDLQERLQARLGFWPDFSDWPQAGLPCWPGPKLIWFDGRMMPTPRACLSQIFGHAIHPTHRLRPTCTRGDCVNPHHRRLEMTAPFTEPLPRAAHAQFIADSMDQTRLARIEECADWLATIDRAMTLTTATLVKRAQGRYDARIIEAALEQLVTQ